MADDYKPLIFRKHSTLTECEKEEESRAVTDHAKREGLTESEIFRIALFRMRFENIGKGAFYDEKLVESRENREDHMDFIKRMNRTYLAH